MTNLPRVTQKIFGANATDVTRTIAQFGSVVAGSPLFTGDIATIQALQNWEDGWVGSTITAKRYPTAEETTGVNKVLSQQIAYLLQKGIPEWDAGTTYYENDYARVNEKLFLSLTDNNLNNDPMQDAVNWKEADLGGGNGYEVGDFVWRSLPTEDSGKHLCDGALIQGSGSYARFVSKIADLYANNPTANYFTDETTWQNTVTAYGSCGKFVYDSVNNTVRLPKVSDIVQGTTDLTALGDLIEAGLPSIEHTHVIQMATSDSGADHFDAGGGTGSTYSSGGINSQLNPIYGRSNTVQPQTIKALLYIVIANSTKTNIEVDIDEVITDLNGKADTDLTNVTTTGRELINSLSIPRNGIGLTLGASPAVFIAPSDGWFALGKRASDMGQYLAGNNQTTNFRFCMTASSSGLECFAIIPARKGETVAFDYNAGGAVVSFYFHPLTTT